jgi:hypothetical protein
MKFRRYLSPSFVLSVIALFVALGGGAYAATEVAFANNAGHLGGKVPSFYLASKHFVTSHGVRFLGVGQKNIVLGHAGHFTFLASCTNPSGQPGAQVASFDVVADTTADMDANGGPRPAGTPINIHMNSDAMDTTADAPLNAGDFDQVGSASDSTEIAADGQEVDVFYNDGVNWPAGNGSRAHDRFAGYTGLVG